jgi:UDP-GlcNAc:undecaprenyl-phosphate GlcNAc-1-phosphate transferase
MVPACLSLIILAFAISLPLTWACRRAAGRLGQLDEPGARKLHDRPIPVTGGIAITVSVLGPMALAVAAGWLVPESTWRQLIAPVADHLDHARGQTGLALALIASVAALHVVGLVDDRRGLGPYSKLAVQLAVSLVLVIGFDVRLLELAGPIASILLTVLWLVAITNAFNFLDNMDGLSGGVAVICGSLLMATALVESQWFVAAALGLLVGALLGFLVFNFPPASIFMGDGGSLVVGFVIAVCSVRVVYYGAAPETHWWGVFTPVLVLAIPLYDLASVTLIRLLQGRNPLVGDTQHFSHRLVRKGLSRRAAVIVIWAAALATGLGGVMLSRLAAWQAALVVVQTAAVLVVLALLDRKTPSKSDTV